MLGMSKSTSHTINHVPVAAPHRHPLGRSKFRQIPDNQEVFVQEDGNASLIVEVVQVPHDAADYEDNVKYTIFSPRHKPSPC